ncbi:exosortase X [Rhodohalobacter sulfatireducens]|uniref:Archaeosortase/exosortase family protein n=1 Tax=Rhodohalobacter sulfatireducens TaxID=2911366 RepID=A0ABS9KDF2_9BACT|nr:archaeosortase/exosortase family protein [Rhodohalobacter sulfatireducens]MCG2588880.1 archaeosortase/exosortase family protein [Rhodohalobacter sulfatireducens]MDR9364346.1 archaeosortase/exosortase family protein [Balneolaceae bacterium]
MSSIKSFFKSDIARFLVKVVCIYFVWYMVYELWILPNGYIDEPLSKNIASISAGVLTFMGEDVFYYGRVVGIVGTAGGEIVDGCNGIAAIGLFLGFIFAYPGAWMPRIFFSIFGIAVIYLVNVARIVILSYTQYYWPQVFDFTHDYSTTAIFYFVIFILWMIWANYGEPMDLDTSGKSLESAVVT